MTQYENVGKMKLNLIFYFIILCIICGTCTAENKIVKRKILFIVNPISHRLQDQDIENVIRQNLNRTHCDYQIAYTKFSNHAFELAKEAVLQRKADVIVAVGGDGTVNEVGRALINTDLPMSIIPVGSGNGLARHLRIPKNFPDAVKALHTYVPIIIDTGKVNDQIFLNIAGIGFDAHIAWEFANYGKRGFSGYLQLVLKEYAKYRDQTYRLIVDGKKIDRKAFVVSFANSSQYGSNIIIAPKARLQDGFLDLVIVKEIPFYALPGFIIALRKGTLHQSSYVETIRCKEVRISQPQFQAHLDGEPVKFLNEIDVKIQPSSLKLLAPIY